MQGCKSAEINKIGSKLYQISQTAHSLPGAGTFVFAQNMHSGLYKQVAARSTSRPTPLTARASDSLATHGNWHRRTSSMRRTPRTGAQVCQVQHSSQLLLLVLNQTAIPFTTCQLLHNLQLHWHSTGATYRVRQPPQCHLFLCHGLCPTMLI
jgi:hypothetical protein